MTTNIGLVNARFLEEEMTGVGRFAFEVTKRLSAIFPTAEMVTTPGAKIPQYWKVARKGFYRGAFWEQFLLPFFVPQKADWCFNPANTCSLLVGNNVTVVHDIIALTNPEWYSLQARMYYRLILPLVIHRSRLVITVSEANRQEINRVLGTALDKIHVVPNAVDDFWKPVDEKPAIGNYLLTVGSLDPRKNLKRLIQAFLKLEDLSLKLVIVGHKHKAFADEELSLTLKDSDRVVFTGYISDEEVRSLYSHALLFVYPTLKEGFGIPPLEAMKCECPVVASRIPSVNEVCGEAVHYIEDPFDVSSIHAALFAVSSDERIRQQLKVKGSARASYFNWDDSTEKIAQILKGMNGLR